MIEHECDRKIIKKRISKLSDSSTAYLCLQEKAPFVPDSSRRSCQRLLPGGAKQGCSGQHSRPKLQLLSAHGHTRNVASLTEDPWRELEWDARDKFGEIENRKEVFGFERSSRIFKVEKSRRAPGRLQLASFGTRFALPLDKLSRNNSCSFAGVTVYSCETKLQAIESQKIEATSISAASQGSTSYQKHRQKGISPSGQKVIHSRYFCPMPSMTYAWCSIC